MINACKGVTNFEYEIFLLVMVHRNWHNGIVHFESRCTAWSPALFQKYTKCKVNSKGLLDEMSSSPSKFVLYMK